MNIKTKHCVVHNSRLWEIIYYVITLETPNWLTSEARKTRLNRHAKYVNKRMHDIIRKWAAETDADIKIWRVEIEGKPTMIDVREGRIQFYIDVSNNPE